MKQKPVLRTALCLVLLLALMAAGVYGVNGFTAPIVAENERLAAEAAAEAEKALLGDSVLLYDRSDPAASALTVTAESVQSVYRDETKQTYLLRLATFEGYTKDIPIELALVIDFEGRIVSLDIESSGETKELDPGFLSAFAGQDSTLSGVNLVAGVTFSSAAIKNAVNDGFNTLIDNGLFAAAEKDDAQLLNELISQVYPGIVNKAGAVQGEELEGSGSVTGGYQAANGSGFAWFVSADGNYLAVCTAIGGVKLYNTAGDDVTDAVDAALLDEIAALSAAKAEDLSAKQTKALGRMVGEETELVPVEIPGLCSSITGVYKAETAEGIRYGFAARPYGYSNEVMELYYVLDENGAIVSWRVAELILHSEYFNSYTLDEPSYKEGFIGLTGESYSGEQALIAGATMSTEAVDAATRDVFEAFALLAEMGE